MKTLDEKIAEARAKINKNWRPKLEIVESIQAAAIAVFDVDKVDFFNGCRHRPVSYARMVSMALCRARTSLTPEEIALLHGGLDRSNVYHAAWKVKNGKALLTAGAQEVARILQSDQQSN